MKKKLLDKQNKSNLGPEDIIDGVLFSKSIENVKSDTLDKIHVKSIKKIDLPKAKTIHFCTFEFFENVTEIYLPSLEVVSFGLFDYCYKLVKININKATIMDNDLFRGCVDLEEIIHQGKIFKTQIHDSQCTIIKVDDIPDTHKGKRSK